MKYNCSKIMRNAWNLIRTQGMTRSAALKAAWAAAKNPVEMIGAMRADVIDKLIAMGATRWNKGSYDRLYLNAAACRLIGLEILGSYKASGRISHARLNGEEISNSRATEYAKGVYNLYIDIATGDLMDGSRCSHACTYINGERTTEVIRQAIIAMAA